MTGFEEKRSLPQEASIPLGLGRCGVAGATFSVDASPLAGGVTDHCWTVILQFLWTVPAVDFRAGGRGSATCMQIRTGYACWVLCLLSQILEAFWALRVPSSPFFWLGSAGCSAGS